MFSPKFVLKDVTSYACSNIELVICTNFKKIETCLPANKKIFESLNNLSSLSYNIHFFCNETNPGSGVLIKNGVPLKLESKMIKHILSDDLLICSFNGETIIQNLITGDMNKILPNKLFTFIIVNNFLYSCNAGVITKVELSKKLVDWQINLNDKKLTDCIQFIGEYRNELWILAKGGMFVNIDSTTGTVKGLIKNILQENIHGPIELFVKDNEGNRSPDDRNFYHLDQQKGKIIGESAKGIWEIDLTRPEPYLEVWGMEDQYNLHGLHDIGYKTVLQGDDLYFIDFNALKWGVIDVNNKKLKWVSEKITNAVTQLKEIQVAGNRAHILDGTKTLHVFEKLSA